MVYKNRIAEELARKNVSLRYCSEKTGIPLSTLSRLKNCEGKMNMQQANALALFFNCTTDYISGMDETNKMDELLSELKKFGGNFDELSDKAYCIKIILSLSDEAAKDALSHLRYIQFNDQNKDLVD
ncbi:MAG: helix-turn-helix transcriptional regulator [Erysipelotrichaceae bacterium]|nr:helix-turn-helix transcriptional regulator [Erysipelotrichaceae bacterium]